jgi:PAS domain S-box-containing protein
MKIMIIEDDPGLAELVKENVEECGFSTVLFYDASMALDWLKENQPDLMILDYNLPDMNGNEFLSNLKNSNRPRPSFIISTGQGDEKIAVEMMKLGARDYLIKNNNFLNILPEVVKRVVKEIQNENRLKIAEEDLRQNLLKNNALIANISDVIGIIGTDGLIKHKSSNIEKWFGWKPGEQIGKDGFSDIHPEDLERIQLIFKELLERDKSSATMEFRYKCKDGTYKPVELTATNLANDEIIGGVLINYHDITERKKAEYEQKSLQEQLAQSQKMESVGQLAGGVAHDFNNMLGVILGHTELLMMKLDPSLSMYEDLEEIMKATTRSAQLTGQLLAFARKQTASPQVIDLNNTIRSIYTMLKRLIGEDIDLLWRPSHEILQVNMDPSQIDQILTNLCINSRDAIISEGRIVLETGTHFIDGNYFINQKISTAGEYVFISISDNGQGMDEETRSRVFEPFFTTKKTGKGTGLGLATVYGIVKQNNGYIEIETEPDRGTSFKLYLPRIREESDAERKIDSPDLTGKGSATILLVEDEAAILKMTTKMLQTLGYTVLSAGTPTEAFNLLRKFSGTIQLLITDVVMPEMNGRDLAGQILVSYPDLKSLYMSGYSDDIIADHGILEKGVNFIQKPFTMKDLGNKVHEIMSGSFDEN